MRKVTVREKVVALNSGSVLYSVYGTLGAGCGSGLNTHYPIVRCPDDIITMSRKTQTILLARD